MLQLGFDLLSSSDLEAQMIWAFLQHFFLEVNLIAPICCKAARFARIVPDTFNESLIRDQAESWAEALSIFESLLNHTTWHGYIDRNDGPWSSFLGCKGKSVFACKKNVRPMQSAKLQAASPVRTVVLSKTACERQHLNKTSASGSCPGLHLNFCFWT